MDDEARRELHRVLDDGLGALRSSLWIASLVYLADACALLGDREAAAVLYPELARYAGGNVMIGHLVGCYGAMDRYLGMTASVLGEWERAEAHFQRRARAQHAARRADVARAHRVLVRAHAARARRAARTATSSRRTSRSRSGSGGRSACRALVARASASSGAAEPAEERSRTGSRAARPRSSSSSPAGRSNREIGRLLHISEHTAANHIRSILRKTSSANRTEAAGYAMRRGLVPD